MGELIFDPPHNIAYDEDVLTSDVLMAYSEFTLRRVIS